MSCFADRRTGESIKRARKNSIEIRREGFQRMLIIEEAVMKVAEAHFLEESDIEISHELKRKGNNMVIVKFVSHETKKVFYKARMKQKKTVKLSYDDCSAIQSLQKRIYINENLVNVQAIFFLI